MATVWPSYDEGPDAMIAVAKKATNAEIIDELHDIAELFLGDPEEFEIAHDRMITLVNELKDRLGDK